METDKLIAIIKKIVKYIFWITVGSILIYWLISDHERFAFIKEKISGITAPFIFGSVCAALKRCLRNLFGSKAPAARWRYC